MPLLRSLSRCRNWEQQVVSFILSPLKQGKAMNFDQGPPDGFSGANAAAPALLDASRFHCADFWDVERKVRARTVPWAQKMLSHVRSGVHSYCYSSSRRVLPLYAGNELGLKHAFIVSFCLKSYTIHTFSSMRILEALHFLPGPYLAPFSGFVFRGKRCAYLHSYLHRLTLVCNRDCFFPICLVLEGAKAKP